MMGFMRSLIAAVLLLALGMLLLPLEKNITEMQSPSSCQKEAVLDPLWKVAGASGCMAALSGFRAPLAAALWIAAFTAWEKKEWERMADLMEVVLLLEPHQILYCDMAAWHLAWNACGAAKSNEESLFYMQHGRSILEEGIRNNPESSLLYAHLGLLLRDKLQDHAAAAVAFAKAAALPGAVPYLRRFAAYELAKCPEHEEEAYAQLQALYQEGPEQRVPALLAILERLEKKQKKLTAKGHKEKTARFASSSNH